jgi:thiamine biosynthesis lipoprotein
MDADEIHELRVARQAMACQFEVIFNVGDYREATEWAVEALDLVEQLESRLTVYRDSSELIRLNAAAGLAPARVAPDLMRLLLRARHLHDATQAAVDVAAGRLVRAWGFLARHGRTPSDEVLAAAKAHSGMHLVELDEQASTVAFRCRGLELNLGSIGKGWAIDRAVELLQRRGASNACLHGGRSSVRAIGHRRRVDETHRGWPVGLRHPLRPNRRLATFHLSEKALGTSGSGTQFFVENGRKLGHILDPRSGRPAEGVLSATVVTNSAADADGLATALYVLGEAGLPMLAADAQVGGLLVLPPESRGRIRVVRFNLDDSVCEVAADESIELLNYPGSAPSFPASV